MTPLENLTKLGLELPQPTTPGGSYISLNIRGNIAYLAIQFPILNQKMMYRGKLGETLTTEEGSKAMELCALNVLSQIHHKIGFENIVGLNHMDAYYLATEAWDEAPKMVNGASDLFVNVLGEKGNHSRAIFGVYKLPRNFCGGITVSLTLKTN